VTEILTERKEKKGDGAAAPLCQIDPELWTGRNYRPISGGFCTIERSKQINTRTAKAPATNMTFTSSLPIGCAIQGPHVTD
jgi:hypothetical protein